MIIDRRKPRKCIKCGLVKSKDSFHRKRALLKSGDTAVYCQSVCIQCINEIKRKSIPEDELGPEKRCHCCYKYKPNDQYRKQKRGANIVLEASICIECEQKHGQQPMTQKHEVSSDRRQATVNDIDKADYHCAFIGQHSYRHICKVFGIRYSTKKLLNEKTYKQMNK